jgi:hypothetical protein
MTRLVGGIITNGLRRELLLEAKCMLLHSII